MASRSFKSRASDNEAVPTQAPPSVSVPTASEILGQERAVLHPKSASSWPISALARIFTPYWLNNTTCLLVLSSFKIHPTATVSKIGKWQYWLQITSGDKERLGQPVIADINPGFNFEYLSFIFNHSTDDGSAYSWLLRCKDQETEERFQEGLIRALWEQLNNFEYLSFNFNHYTDDRSAYSWLLRFKDQETEERFQKGLSEHCGSS